MYKANLLITLARVATLFQYAHAFPHEGLAPRQLVAGGSDLGLGASQQQSASFDVQVSQLASDISEPDQSSSSSLPAVSSLDSVPATPDAQAGIEAVAELNDSVEGEFSTIGSEGDDLTAMISAIADLSASVALSTPRITGVQSLASAGMSDLAAGSIVSVAAATVYPGTIATSAASQVVQDAGDAGSIASALPNAADILLSPGIVTLPTLTFSLPLGSSIASPVSSPSIGIELAGQSDCKEQLSFEVVSLMRAIEERVGIIQSQLISLSAIVAASQLGLNGTSQSTLSDGDEHLVSATDTLVSIPSTRSAGTITLPVDLQIKTASVALVASAVIEGGGVVTGLAALVQSIPVFPTAADHGYAGYT